MTIIELVIAFVILMVVLVPVAMLLSNTIGQAASSRERLTALSLAEQFLEKLNNTPVLKTTATAHAKLETTADPTVPKTAVTVHVTSTTRSTVHYTIYAHFTWALHQATDLDLCQSGTAPTLLDLQVTVEWGHTQQKITDTTLIDFPATGILSEGFLSVSIYGDPVTSPPNDVGGNAWSTRVKAVPVTIHPGPTVTTGFSTITRYPNQYGCVFQEVPAGTYTVSVADPSPGTPPGTNYGTPSWASSDDELLTQTSASTAVTVGVVATVTFQYDEGSMAKVTYPSSSVVEGDVTCPGAGVIDCIVAGQSPASATSPGATPTAVLSVLTTTASKTTWNEYKTPATRLVASACAKRCISVGSVRTGAGFRGASVSTRTTTVSFTADSVPGSVTSLSSVTCPSTSTCYAYGANGTILTGTVTAASVSWQADSGLTGVTTIHALSCLAASTCYAAVSTSSGPAVLSLSSATAWHADTLPTKPSAVSSVSGVTCGPSTCFVDAASASGVLVLSLKATSTTVWIEDTVPAASSLAAIACPSATHCYAIGKASGSPTIQSLASVTGTTVTWTTDTITTTTPLTSLTALTCPGSSACFASGTTAKGAAIVSLYKSTSSWRIDSMPTDVTGITAMACSSSAQCDAATISTVGGTPGAIVLSLSTTKGAWTPDAFASGVDPVYLAGVACSAGKTVCTAPGATTTGAVLQWSTLSGTKWHSTAPSAVTGMYVGDTPIAVYNPGLSPTTTVEVASPKPATGDVKSIGPLFPFTTGYEVGATACAGGISSTAPTVASVPGTTFSAKPTTTTVPTAALRMGLLPIEVESATGSASPVAGATVTIAPSCTRLAAPSGHTNQTSFTLGTTDGSGVASLAVMYGTYTVTVKSGKTTATATVTVSKTTITAGATTTTLPNPAVIRL